jgi:PAS domain S-box-containing protein
MISDEIVFESLKEVTNWGILTTDAALNVTSVNRWFETNCGRPAAEILGGKLFDLFPELAARQLDQTYHRVLAGTPAVLSQRLHGFIFKMPASIEGSPHRQMQQSARIAPLLKDGQVIGTLTMVEDVTERVEFEAERTRLEDALRLRIEQLAAADKRKDEFLAMLAHELRNPLAPIRNSIQILRIHSTPDSEREWARDVIERQVDQMTRLVDDLLDVSRITSGKIRLQPAAVDVAAVMEGALEISRPLIDAHGHILTVSIEPRPLTVHGDATRLKQAISNLLSNAAKYTPNGGRISLTAAREGDDIVVRVRDSGIGIPAEMLPHVFDLFTQVHRSIDRTEGGLGIGLTLVRDLVEMHGGRVEACSAGSGQGSEFAIFLAAWAGTAASVETPPSPGVSTPTTSRKILVVDDNVDCAMTLAMLLKKLGNSVNTAFSGTEAMVAVARDQPDIVFMDIGLPGMDGYEVARRLRAEARFKVCVLVAVSGYGQDEDRRRSLAAGFDHHLVKPVTLQRLKELLLNIR